MAEETEEVLAEGRLSPSVNIEEEVLKAQFLNMALFPDQRTTSNGQTFLLRLHLYPRSKDPETNALVQQICVTSGLSMSHGRKSGLPYFRVNVEGWHLFWEQWFRQRSVFARITLNNSWHFGGMMSTVENPFEDVPLYFCMLELDRFPTTKY